MQDADEAMDDVLALMPAGSDAEAAFQGVTDDATQPQGEKKKVRGKRQLHMCVMVGMRLAMQE